MLIGPITDAGACVVELYLFSSKGARNYFRIVIRNPIVTVAADLRAENGRRAHDDQHLAIIT
jgi:hypothetical protein